MGELVSEIYSFEENGGSQANEGGKFELRSAQEFDEIDEKLPKNLKFSTFDKLSPYI